MASEEIKLIIDSDGGVDDAIATLIALNKSNVNVLALISVFGNTSSEQAAENLRRFVGKSTMHFQTSYLTKH